MRPAGAGRRQPMTTRILILAGAVLALLLMAAPGGNAEAQPLQCLDCHEDFTAGSVHEGALYCEDCHEDVTSEDHIDTGAAPVDCSICHDGVAQVADHDLHHRLLGAEDAPRCADCHTGHQVQPPAEVENPAETYCAQCHDSIVMTSTYHKQQFIPEETCQECHEADEYHKTLAGSVHDRFACVDCHGYVANNFEQHQDEGIPYERLSDCRMCHRGPTEQHRDSIHGIAIQEGIDDAANCWDCHGSHDVLPADSELSPVNPVNLPKTCGACHDNPEFAQKYGLMLRGPAMAYAQSVHGKLLLRGNTDAPTCENCHGVHDIKNRVQPGSTISPFTVPDTCGKCHQELHDEYVQSSHWVAARRGIGEAPVCNDCHTEHAIVDFNGQDRAQHIREIQEQTCFQCHQDPRIARRFALSGEQIHQYQDSYHGMAMVRGDLDVAMCIDCHGGHKILPKRHPESTVNEANVLQTCQQCHPNANQTFAASYTHEAASRTTRVIEYWVKLVYVWLVWLVIGGMLLHNALIFAYEVRARGREHQRVVSVPRFTRNEVVQHVLLAASFIVLAVTGFALTYPQLWPFNWLGAIGLTEDARQITHRSAGVVMLVLGVYHVGYMLFTRRGRYLLRRFRVGLRDALGAAGNVAYYLGLRRERPAFDTFDYTEKAEYWALIWGTVVMGVTGIVLWFPTDVSENAPGWLIPVSEIVHFYEAVLATLAIIVWHWFFVIFHPREYPLSFTMVDGRIELEHFKHHHAAEFRRIYRELLRLNGGEIGRNQLSYEAGHFVDAMERHNLDAYEVLHNEVQRDPHLRSVVESD